MKATIEIDKTIKFIIDFTKPQDISIPLNPGKNNPNCYWAEDVNIETISTGDFVGSVKAGGSVNYQKITLTPHGNGTHTECYGHLTEDGATINEQLRQFNFLCQLITVEPELMANDDKVITAQALHKQLSEFPIKALIIRTIPNDVNKLTRQYSGTNPPYFSKEFMSLLVEKGIEHVLVDLPSVDKEVDGGKLAAHRTFWGLEHSLRKTASITELIFVDNAIKDGLFLLNLQFPSLNMDAAPSKPIIYPILNFC